MGQIVGLAAKCRRVNLSRLADIGTPASGEYILVSSDNSMQADGQGNFDCFIMGDGSRIANLLEVKRIETDIEQIIGTNLYDGNGTVDGQYVRNCVVPIDSSMGTFILSTEGNNVAYFSNTFFIDGSGNETTATRKSYNYSQNLSRQGNLYDIPSTAKHFKFTYRAQYSGGPLIRKVMVTYGDTYYNDYYPYQKSFCLKNPYIIPYSDAVEMPVYVSPSGNDSNDGTIDSPFFTLARAMQENRKIIMRGGLYDYGWSYVISLESLRYGKLDIEAYKDEEPIIFKGTKIATTATLMTGSTKVYEAAVSYDPNAKCIYQWGVPDETTLITDAERTPYHQDRTYRNPFCTSIRVTDSIASIESSDDYLYYYDSGTGKVYFSCPSAPSAANFIFNGYSRAFDTTSLVGKEVHLKGLTFVGTSCNIGNTVNSVLEDCKAIGVRYSGGFSMDNVKNATVLRCEACVVDNGASAPSGDGFNVHVDSGKTATFKIVDCWSHDCNNDGYSDHEGSFGVIEGGLWEHNSIGGQGSALTPAYGANDIIKNVIVQNNNASGIHYAALSDSEKCGVVIFDSIIRNNADHGVSLQGTAKVEVFNCAIYGNDIGIYGSSYANVISIRTSSFNNTHPDQNVSVVI